MLEPLPDEAQGATPSASQKVSQGWSGAAARCKLELSLRCCYAMMRRKVVLNPKDSIGLLIFNTVTKHCKHCLAISSDKLTLSCVLQAESQGQGDSQLQNCQLVFDLAPITAQTILDMKNLLQGEATACLALIKRYVGANACDPLQMPRTILSFSPTSSHPIPSRPTSSHRRWATAAHSSVLARQVG